MYGVVPVTRSRNAAILLQLLVDNSGLTAVLRIGLGFVTGLMAVVSCTAGMCCLTLSR
jgi:hypothetical protein